MSDDTQVPKANFIALFCEAMMHGMYTVIFGLAMFLLLRRNRGAVSQRVLIGLTVTMYSASTVHVALSLKQCLVAFFEENATSGRITTFNDPRSRWLLGQPTIEMINCIIGDMIVAWRAWVLWGGGTAVLILPTLLIVTGAVMGSLLLHAYATSPISNTLYDPNTTMWVEIFGAVTFSANLYAIGIIAFRAWQHERALNGVYFREGRFHRALLIVIESGAVYCLALGVIVILIAAGNDFGVVIVLDILAHLTGIYPSVILVLVSAKLAYADEIDRSVAFASIRFNHSLGTRRCGTAMGQSEVTSHGLEPVEVDVHMRTSRSEAPSKPFIGDVEEAVGSVVLGERSLQSEEIDGRNRQEV